MRRLSASEMSYTSRFLAKRMIPIWHHPYDADNRDLERLTGMKFDELEEILREACTQANINLGNANYYAFYERDEDTIELIFPLLNSSGVEYPHRLFKKLEQVWHKHARTSSRIEFVRIDLKNARDFKEVMEHDDFLRSLWKYMIVIS